MNDAWLETLSPDDCQSLLRENTFGRLAFVANDFPIVVPVNYRFVESSGRTWIALRTRPDNVDRPSGDEGRVRNRRHRPGEPAGLVGARAGNAPPR